MCIKVISLQNVIHSLLIATDNVFVNFFPIHTKQKSSTLMKQVRHLLVLIASTMTGMILILVNVSLSRTNLLIDPAIHDVSISVELMKRKSIQEFVSAVSSL